MSRFTSARQARAWWPVRLTVLASALGIALLLPGLSGRALAQAQPADLRVEFGYYDGAGGVRLIVSNHGDQAASALTMKLEAHQGGTTTPASVPVPPLGGAESFYYTFQLPRSCASGDFVTAEAPLASDPTPENNSLVAYPCDPDLTVRFEDTDGNNGLVLRVINVGGAPAGPSTLHAETQTQPPSNAVDLPVAALDAGSSTTLTYVLNTTCDGSKVLARVNLASDPYANNNSIMITSCSTVARVATNAAPAVASPDVTTGVVGPTSTDRATTTASAGTAAPTANTDPLAGYDEELIDKALRTMRTEYMAPGAHTLDLTPSNTHTVVVKHTEEGLLGCLLGGNLSGVIVGWTHRDCETYVAQTGVRFNLQPLDVIPSKLVAEATLSFDEEPSSQTPRGYTGCVTTLGLATTDWVANPPEAAKLDSPVGLIPVGAGFFPNETYLDGDPVQSFDLAQVVAESLGHPEEPRYGFVLRGSDEDISVRDAPDTCYSAIGNIRLHLVYVVPD